MLNLFNAFVQFCYEHGGTLRNHIAFGRMSNELRNQIQAQENHIQQLFDVHESFMVYLCKMLDLDFMTSTRMDILQAIAKLDMGNSAYDEYLEQRDK